MSRSVFAVSLLVVAVGCASETTPRGADENGTVVEGETTESTPVAASPSGTSATPHDPSIPCKPGSSRSCFKSWQDALGVANCETTLQYCEKSGKLWLPCGEKYDGVASDSSVD